MPVAATWSFRRSARIREEAAKDRPALDSFLGEIRYGVVGPWWLELQRAVRSSPVVVPGILGHNDAKVPFAEDQHPVSDLGPGGEHEPLRIGVVPHRQLHLIRSIGTDVSG